MDRKILCAGFLVRYPMGGFSWHHLQYLVGLQRLGHDVTYLEDYGWPLSCYDPALEEMTGDPSYGIKCLVDLLRPHGMENKWCYLAEDGVAYGMPRDRLADLCSECDLYLNLSNVNWIPELEQCRRRVSIDTDPVFTQIGSHGSGGRLRHYHQLFTYGENVHQPECSMPTGGMRWLPTRQPVVLGQWQAQAGDLNAPFTTVMNWSAYGDQTYEGRVYGQKDREFEPFYSLPLEVAEPMEMAVSAPASVRRRLRQGGWLVTDPREVTETPHVYQSYLRRSRAEFSVAKHAYVSTRSGWFSERSAGYLASGRPVVLQDTGYSDFLPCGSGLLAFRTPEDATLAIRQIRENYDEHCRSARRIAEEFFDSDRVLTDLLERGL